VLENGVANQPTNTPVFESFLDYIMDKEAKLARRRRRVCVTELYLNGNSGFTKAEFYKLLEKSRFVSSVIDIHIRDRTRLDQYSEPSNSTGDILNIEDSQWQVFVEKYLADWLYSITDILLMQAKFVSRGRPMSRAELAALLHDRFLGWESKDLQLKDGRNEVWSAYTLRSAINRVLPEIKTSGAVTLTNLAKRINLRSREILFRKMKTRLSGKHLQKLLKKHDIDWTRIKKAYKQRLLAEVNGSQSACTEVGIRDRE